MFRLRFGDEHPPHDSHLRSCQTNPVRISHSLNHVVKHYLVTLRDLSDRSAYLPQNRVFVSYDVSQCHFYLPLAVAFAFVIYEKLYGLMSTTAM